MPGPAAFSGVLRHEDREEWKIERASGSRRGRKKVTGRRRCKCFLLRAKKSFDDSCVARCVGSTADLHRGPLASKRKPERAVSGAHGGCRGRPGASHGARRESRREEVSILRDTPRAPSAHAHTGWLNNSVVTFGDHFNLRRFSVPVVQLIYSLFLFSCNSYDSKVETASLNGFRLRSIVRENIFAKLPSAAVDFCDALRILYKNENTCIFI